MWVYLRTGEIHEKQGNLAEALRYYEQAAAVLERLGAAQRLPEVQLSARELAWGNYENLTRVSLKLYAKDHQPDDLRRAFSFHERGKARAFLDLLNEAGVRVHEGVDPRLVSEEDGLHAKISALQSVFSDQRFSDLKRTSLEQALIDQQAALKAVQDKVVAANPRYAGVVSPQVAAIGDVQHLLGNDAVLLEYDLGSEFSGLGVLTARDMQVFRLPSQDVINKALAEFLPTVRAPLFGDGGDRQTCAAGERPLPDAPWAGPRFNPRQTSYRGRAGRGPLLFAFRSADSYGPKGRSANRFPGLSTLPGQGLQLQLCSVGIRIGDHPTQCARGQGRHRSRAAATFGVWRSNCGTWPCSFASGAQHPRCLRRNGSQLRSFALFRGRGS